MAKNGFKAMDSDLHVMEPADLWQRYIDPAYKERAPVGLTRHTRDLGMQVEGRVLPKRIEVGDSSAPMAHREKIMERYKDAIARNFDSASQVEAMDREGLDLAVLFPTRGLFVLGIDGMDPGLAAAIARAYNDWLHDFCQIAPDRMFGAAMVAPHDVESAALEVRRTAKEYGFKSIFLRPNHVNGHLWGDRYYDPLWAACQEHNVAVGFHEGALVDLPQTTPHQLIKTFAMQNVLSLPLSNMFACADMIYGGVFERFPELRVAFLEGNCAWVPWLLWRMEEYMELTGPAEYPDLKLEPQEYFQRQCYASIECDEAVAKHIPEYGLENNIVFSTDYPHRDAKFPDAVASFLELPFTDEIKRKYLWDNCLKLYDLQGK